MGRYTRTYLFQTETKARGSEVRAEYDAIEAYAAEMPSPETMDSGNTNYVVAGGTANAIAVAAPKTWTTYAGKDGYRMTIRITADNTAATTLNVDGLGAIPMRRNDGVPIAAGDLRINGVYDCIYVESVAQFRVQEAINSVLTEATANASASAASAAAAAASESAAGEAAASAAASAASAASAAMGFSGTSTTQLPIGVGQKVFTTQAGEQYTPGIWVTAVSAANNANWMFGRVTAYSGTTLTVDVEATGGSGTFSDWSLSLSGARGAAGPAGPAGSFSGGSLSGELNYKRITVPSAATTADIWTGGNQIDWTGTVTCTGFPAAPQAGASRNLICAAAAPFTAGPNMLIAGVAPGQTMTCAANDIVMVEAVTTTQFRLTRLKYDGTPQAYDAELAAIAALTSAADRLAYFTGSGTAALATFTEAARTLLAAADAAAQLAALGALPKAGGAMTGSLAMGNNNVTGMKLATFTGEVNNATTSGAVTINWTLGATQKQAEPTGAITYTFTDPAGPCRLQLRIIRDGASSAFTHVWPASVKWLGAQWTAAANKSAVISFWYDGSTYWAQGSNEV